MLLKKEKKAIQIIAEKDFLLFWYFLPSFPTLHLLQGNFILEAKWLHRSRQLLSNCYHFFFFFLIFFFHFFFPTCFLLAQNDIVYLFAFSTSLFAPLSPPPKRFIRQRFITSHPLRSRIRFTVNISLFDGAFVFILPWLCLSPCFLLLFLSLVLFFNWYLWNFLLIRYKTKIDIINCRKIVLRHFKKKVRPVLPLNLHSDSLLKSWCPWKYSYLQRP